MLKRKMRKAVVYFQVPSSALICSGLTGPRITGNVSLAAFIRESLLLAGGISQHFLLIM